MEPSQAADPCRVGQYQKDQSQGRGELYLVAVATPLTEGLQQTRARPSQRVDEIPTEERLYTQATPLRA